jgi:hypothetical protein
MSAQTLVVATIVGRVSVGSVEVQPVKANAKPKAVVTAASFLLNVIMQ